ncbi:MAG: pantetheine-phosphate adenylyltransferase, partial [Deltaproteobacteria bacterium]|nr:pantetheine-phosphate adenylyltransferase [Deltaproteobacteria bacterium]
MPKHIAIYPGAFDPITKGHIDVITRSFKLFDELIIAVATDSGKDPLFSVEDRVRIIKNETKKYKKVKVESFDGLLTKYVKKKKAAVVVRGLRVISDFEHEFQMALTNRKLDPEIETVFMMTAESYAPVSSRLVKEIARLGGELRDFVTPGVKKELLRVFKIKAKARS